MQSPRVSRSFLLRAGKTLLPVALACQAGLASAYDMTYLQSLLDATPAGGWVQANTSTFASARPSGASALPDANYTDLGSIVRAWSSMAWDADLGQIYIWGGGHANYMGNEMHVWNANPGTWSLGSLPSRITQVTGTGIDPRTHVVVDGAAPQAAHTFDGSMYLPVNKMFLTVGDAVYDTGGGQQALDGAGNLVRTGPWLWNPALADSTKVGGTTGSGWDPSAQGGNMWMNRQGMWDAGTDGGPDLRYLMSTTAYRTENGRDTVYVTKSGSRPNLYRYSLGNVLAGERDSWEQVGMSWNVASSESTAVIDDLNNLYVQTSMYAEGAGGFDLRVWDLDTAGPTNRDIGVDLVKADGSELRLQMGAGSAYNSEDGAIWLWDGTEGGTLWRTKATFNADGSLATEWLAEKVVSTTVEQPEGSFAFGVFGKWLWADELGAFIAMDEFQVDPSNPKLGDAGVWLFKPMAAAVPEVNGIWLMLAGLGGLGLLRSRRRPQA